MIRGAIERCERSRIAGWIVSEIGSLKGRTVLAFSETLCVGSGTVGAFRADLKSVGLGDGHAGFDFGITLDAVQDLGSVLIRLENSDAALIQTASAVVSRATVANKARS